MTAQETNVVNAVATTLASPMAAGATSFTVTSASGWPSVPFYVVIDPDDPAAREYMLIDSSLAGTTASMTTSAKRNLSGSAGDVDHASGAVVRVSPPMKQLFDDIHDRIDDIANGYTFTGDVTVPDEAYDATGWNGDLTVPTKNAVRDKIETLTTTLTSSAVSLSGTVALSSGTVDVLSTGSLATGTWFVSGAVLAGNAAGANQFFEASIVAGTATATFAGQQSSQDTISTTERKSFPFSVIATVTGAGTLKIQVYTTDTGTAYETTANGTKPKGTGITAVKIA